jgi:ELWxxDGT repeat protein
MRYQISFALGLGLLLLTAPLLARQDSVPRLVRDIRPGPQSSLPSNLVVVGARLCLTADDGVHQTEWWTSDGTEAGTRLVKDLLRDGRYLVISDKQRAVLDGVLYFTFTAEDEELWRTDCTPEGTYRVKDIHPGPQGSHPTELTVLGKQLFFVANDGTRGFELWKSDGSAKGTVPVRSAKAAPVAAKSARKSSSGHSVHRTPNAQQQAAIAGALNYAGAAVGNGPRPKELHVVGNQLVYLFDDGVSGTELWRSDGTDAGTRLLKETRPGKDSISPAHFQSAGRYLYFRSLISDPQLELWRTDGTAEGTVLVKGISSDWSDGGWEQASCGDNIVFTLQKEARNQLWWSDGSEAGTRPLGVGGAASVAATEKGIFILTNPGQSAESTLYALRGGTLQRVTSLPKSPSNSLYTQMVAVSGRLFFDEVASSTAGRTLWTSDGTVEGTFRLGSFAGLGEYGGRYFAAIGQRVYFTAARTDGDVELWSVDF